MPLPRSAGEPRSTQPTVVIQTTVGRGLGQNPDGCARAGLIARQTGGRVEGGGPGGGGRVDARRGLDGGATGSVPQSGLLVQILASAASSMDTAARRLSWSM